ncbi:hypothetical protein PBCV1_a648L [Paramecium bursaria Chlorella virus 1]|uniref:Uncharacterized protein n=1 Tax=Paramecium bursaria Chlorella virus 1 TaxID=10506 RepID=O41130_PBCV1|nr:hypothetical protein PBCV1_a648L [Paramecium bursaria Chlorella virus 1]AAC97035.1 hypothetical protein [Paramecium bursaria Chlorella virus 1]
MVCITNCCYCIVFKNKILYFRFHLVPTRCFLVFACVTTIECFITTTANIKCCLECFKCCHIYHIVLQVI